MAFPEFRVSSFEFCVQGSGIGINDLDAGPDDWLVQLREAAKFLERAWRRHKRARQRKIERSLEDAGESDEKLPMVSHYTLHPTPYTLHSTLYTQN